MRRLRKARLDSGFTIIELLVLIGIVAILVALLLTSLSSAKTVSKKVACASVLKNYGQTLTLFTSDSGVYPLVSNLDGENYPEHKALWYLSLLATLGVTANTASNAGMWYCPAVGDRASARISRDSDTEKTFVNYGYNGFGVMGDGGKAPLGLGGHAETGLGPPVKVAEVTNPAGMIAVGDGFVGGKGQVIDGAHIVGIQFNFKTPFGDGTRRAMRRHGGELNVVFCDGHVEGVDLKKIYFDHDPALLQRLNRDNAPHLDRLGKQE